LKIYADCGSAAEMASVAGAVAGFTTNPSLLRASGVTDYAAFGKTAARTYPHQTLSFEVVADDPVEMMRQAHEIASWGDNVFVKIPVTLCDGTPTTDLIHNLSHDGVKVNVTAVFTYSQAREVGDALHHGQDSIISVFAGRIADTGVDPVTVLAPIVRYLAAYNVRPKVLWASAREVLNVEQARAVGCDIITLSPALVKRRLALHHEPLTDYSLKTVRQFHDDAKSAGFTL
jgi:transaldolase